jgi:hypothetical protein
MFGVLVGLVFRIGQLDRDSVDFRQPPDPAPIFAGIALKIKKLIGDHALPQRGFGLGTPEGAEGWRGNVGQKKVVSYKATSIKWRNGPKKSKSGTTP